jgi:hypothetical protein
MNDLLAIRYHKRLASGKPQWQYDLIGAPISCRAILGDPSGFEETGFPPLARGAVRYIIIVGGELHLANFPLAKRGRIR